MRIRIESKKVKDFSKKERDLINRLRVREWGRNARVSFRKDYEPNTVFFFLKDNNRTVALVGLRPIKINYLDKSYNIFGICCLIASKKGIGYGRILISVMITYLKKTNKTALGFTDKTQFCKKAGLEIKKGFIKRFIYKNKKTGEIIKDDDGDGIYYNGKDNFVGKILKTKSPIYINVLPW
ncbi:hypothetical protein KAJ38_01395 [Candidatus Pacearchaeota archaeon]|nr:hypothetical protein [Candidatus Pacearchaeota archaeon]